MRDRRVPPVPLRGWDLNATKGWTIGRTIGNIALCLRAEAGEARRDASGAASANKRSSWRHARSWTSTAGARRRSRRSPVPPACTNRTSIAPSTPRRRSSSRRSPITSPSSRTAAPRRENPKPRQPRFSKHVCATLSSASSTPPSWTARCRLCSGRPTSCASRSPTRCGFASARRWPPAWGGWSGFSPPAPSGECSRSRTPPSRPTCSIRRCSVRCSWRASAPA